MQAYLAFFFCLIISQAFCKLNVFPKSLDSFVDSFTGFSSVDYAPWGSCALRCLLALIEIKEDIIDLLVSMKYGFRHFTQNSHLFKIVVHIASESKIVDQYATTVL